ncbi:MAG TPA: pantoate--beta-alanine ligase [Longimicrobiales bacterium]|nr:pantoate--beta-alanine ligase [Longimicrobiales bacterium]
MIRIETSAELREVLGRFRADGRTIGFVPTMGYLHEGHLALCDAANAAADVVVMSIFVNPLQFGEGEDLDRYPRDLERDASLAAGRDVDILFTPDAGEIYPHGPVAVRVRAPGLEDRLCGAFRPGHFEGVLTVVAKLFNIVRPDVAVFGQKDLQQAALIRRMAQDLNFPVAIEIAPVVREPDGLALSSRNVYLSPAERASALALSRALAAAQAAFAAGQVEAGAVVAAARATLDAVPGVEVQYVELVDTQTLDTPAQARVGDAVAVAAFVGATRLIDNHVLDHSDNQVPWHDGDRAAGQSREPS